ncbi:hypothetical protein [Stutzerimonas stutzeri]|jgi:hypothetical protein|uniref:hypothetical protein n=1 Tax=Stutzerimonas stutzeri TaxID=316 RepID=UPI00244C6434|nr:hypothetical protein [Stutzerimonas stutzeri]MBW8336505.1 hypothetical protein [Pseudomonas sp.]MDH0060002.1 hypothetical protein [Stutzerimonas stutzeri]
MPYYFKESDLTSEKSLWDVYRLSSRIRSSKLQKLLILTTITLLSINSFYLEQNTSTLLEDAREWASFGFTFSITTLGFLIAGFTIFATLSKPKMMLAMMDHINTETDLPTLKYNFFAFMKVFIAYIALAFIYTCVVIFGQKDGFISNIIDLTPHAICTKTIAIKTSYIFLGSSLVYLLLLLKTFIFNIYAIVMNSLRWEYHQP